MLEDLKVTDDPKQVGYYAGVIESKQTMPISIFHTRGN
jgi:hypothetical protein